MRKRLTQKQTTFALNIFKGMSQREAWKEAGYSTRYPIAHIDRDASLLANSPKILQRLQELNKRTEDASVMDVLERKQVLTEIGRANMINFVEVGQDGAWFNIDETNLNSRALQSVQSKTVLGKDGADDAVFIRVNLHDPTKAIDLLNKMDKLYSDGYQDNRVVNRVVNVFVIDSETKNLISRVGERTKLISNGHENDQSIQGDS